LWTPYGTSMFSTYFNSDAGIIELPFDGEYKMVFSGQNYDAQPTGDISFQLAVVQDDSASLTRNQITSGSISIPGQVDRHTFSLAEARRILVKPVSNLSTLQWSLTNGRTNFVFNRRFTSDFLNLVLPPDNYVLT